MANRIGHMTIQDLYLDFELLQRQLETLERLARAAEDSVEEEDLNGICGLLESLQEDAAEQLGSRVVYGQAPQADIWALEEEQ